jgi:xanthine dehydrogenase accessory factor
MVNVIGLEQKAKELTELGQHFTVATVVRCQSPTSAKPGAKAIVTYDGEIFGWIGGGCAQPAVRKAVRECIQSGQAQLIRVTPSPQTDVEDGIVKFNMACHSGGTLDIFIEPVTVKPILLILGASPVAQALSKIASLSGFEVTVAAKDIDSGLFDDKVNVLESFHIPDMFFNRMPHVVVSTQGKHDNAGLKTALDIASPYTALIASSKKAKKLLEAVTTNEETRAAAKNVKFPAGINIGANTPQEIAVALLAELIQFKNTSDADMLGVPKIQDSSAQNAHMLEPQQNQQTKKSNPSAGCCGST